jgi:hypothetical protein
MKIDLPPAPFKLFDFQLFTDAGHSFAIVPSDSDLELAGDTLFL